MSHRLGLLAAVAAVADGSSPACTSRAHYPQDVMAGLVFGAVVTLGGYLLVRPLLRRLLTLIADTALRILIAPAKAEPVAVQNESR